MILRNKGLGATLNAGAATIAATIQQVEGYYPPSSQYPNGTLAYQNNNPGNLIFANQPGAVPGAGGFAAFSSYDVGYQALLNQIQSYANQGLTIDQMMAKYAPATQTGNNPTLYAQKIADSLGVSTDTTVADALGGGGGVTVGVNTAPNPAPGSAMTWDGGDTSVSAGFGTDSATILGLDPITVILVGGIIAAAVYLR